MTYNEPSIADGRGLEKPPPDSRRSIEKLSDEDKKKPNSKLQPRTIAEKRYDPS